MPRLSPTSRHKRRQASLLAISLLVGDIPQQEISMRSFALLAMRHAERNAGLTKLLGAGVVALSPGQPTSASQRAYLHQRRNGSVLAFGKLQALGQPLAALAGVATPLPEARQCASDTQSKCDFLLLQRPAQRRAEVAVLLVQKIHRATLYAYHQQRIALLGQCGVILRMLAA